MPTLNFIMFTVCMENMAMWFWVRTAWAALTAGIHAWAIATQINPGGKESSVTEDGISVH